MRKTSFTPLDYSENAVDENLLRTKLGDKLKDLTRDSGQVVLHVARENLLDVARTLKEDSELDFSYFTDITAADRSRFAEYDTDERFQLIVILFSLKLKKRVRIKVLLPEDDPSVDSLTPLFKGADWTERETYEMYGITFKGHPNLKRLLTPEYMKYFPLRKDYPMQGRGERDNFPRYEEIR